jgi:ABC-2 type transport system ATP-binding protein
MVAKALIHKPRLLILDEPTAGVDVNLRRALWDFVRLINRQGTTVLLTTHYLGEAEEMCGRIAIMNHGELVGLDTTRNLMSRLDQRKLEVRLRERLAEVPAALQSLQPLLKEEGAVWEFSLSKGTDAGTVLGQLYEQRIALAEVETRSASLEEVFLSLTREPAPPVRTSA